MAIIKKKTRKGSAYYTDTFKSYNSLKQYGKHVTVNHKKNLVDKTNHNHITGIEGFWSYTKHKMYNYRGVAKENILEPILKLYFGYYSY